jgi:polyhydroxyalkanoate synthesis regulator phasin
LTEEQTSTTEQTDQAQPESPQSQPESAQSEPAQPEPTQSESPQPESAEAAPKKPRARKQSTAKKTRTVELTLTVTGTADGEWQADLLHAGKRIVQALPIAAAAVSKAAAELHQDISDTIESVLNEARQQHEAKLAELEAEVERVRKALAELES